MNLNHSQTQPLRTAAVRPGGYRQRLGLGAAFSSVLLAAVALGADLPSAEDLFQRHLQAIGGAPTLRQAGNMLFSGEADLVAMKAKGRIEFLLQAPDRFYFEFRYHHAFFGKIKVPFVGKRQLEWGYDGSNGWSVDLEKKIEPLQGMDLVLLRSLLDKFSPLYFGRSFQLARNLGVERFGEHDCYRVLVVLSNGEHAFEYYDLKDGIAVGAVYPFELDAGGMLNLRMSYGDFHRTEKGLFLPYKLEIEFAGQQIILRANELRTGVVGLVIPPSKLKTPAPQPPTLKPTTMAAADVLKKYIAALGAREAICGHSSLHVSGQFQMPGRNGFTKPIEIFSSVPNRPFVKLEMPKGLHRQGCDGEHYWRSTGNEIKFAEGKDLEQRTAQVAFLSELHEPGLFQSMETLGIIPVNGRNCYLLLLVRKNGEVFDEFYDVETGLLQMRRWRDEASNGDATLVETFGDYRRIGDRLVPMHQVVQPPGATENLTFSSAEWDRVPASTFELPADVKNALKSKTKKTEAGSP